MCTVLLVDDDVAVRNSLKYFLTSEGYSVIAAINASEAYDAALETIPDVIITDIHMPEMDGFDLRNKLKDNLKTNAIPVIFLTADNTAFENKKAESNPTNIFITKPFMFEDILNAINVYSMGHNK